MTTIKKITVAEAQAIIVQDNVILVDVRDEKDFEERSIPNAVHVDQYNFSDFVEQTDKKIPLIIYCYRGNRSYTMAQRFIDEGFEIVYNLEGGYNAWKA